MILPSLLTTNKRIARERIKLAEQMSGWLHIDWLDHTLYLFESLSLEDLATLDFGPLLLEVHCMTNSPIQLVESKLPIERVVLHYELKGWESAFMKLTDQGLETWVAIDPDTPMRSVHLPSDMPGVVLMGVIPGQTGQALIPETLDRILEFKDFYPDVSITIDGGVSEQNIRSLIAHGVDNVVMGGGLFHQANPVEAYKRCVQLSDPIGGAL